MQSLDKIKRRIRSIETTSKITGAMKLVATAKMKRLMNQHKVVHDFCQDFYDIIEILVKTIHPEDTKKKNENQTNLWILISSSLGLCGSFNINVCKHLMSKMKHDDKVIVIGRKGFNYLRSHDLLNSVIQHLDFSNNNLDYLEMLPLCEQIINEYHSHKFNTVRLVYTKFVNSLTFDPIDIQLLPFDSSLFQHLNPQDKKMSLDLDEKKREIEYEPSKEDILESSISIFIATTIFAAISESRVCENGARRNAMETATDNAKDLMNELTLEFNDARQQNITQEINEIVAGADGSSN